MLLTNTDNLAIDQGKRIIILRKLTHLSRRAFARKHDIALGSLQNWESGRYKSLSRTAAKQLLQAFQREGIACNAQWLLYGIGEDPSHKGLETSLAMDTQHSSHSDRVALYAKTFSLNRELFQATEAGRSRDVASLITQGADLHLQKGVDLQIHVSEENSLLHIAAWNGHKEVAEVLIEHGVEIDARNRRQQTPLFLAVYRGYREMIDLLLLRKANINALEDQGDTPLGWAVYTGKTDMAAHLLALGARYDITNIDGNTALHWAAYRGYVDIVELLVQTGADPKIKNNRGETALDCACNKGHQAIVDFLVAR